MGRKMYEEFIMSRILIVIKLGVIIGLTVFDPFYYMVHKDIPHQDHEAHEEEDKGFEKRKAALKRIRSAY